MSKPSQDFGVYDDHTHSHSKPTVTQLALALVWIGAGTYYFLFNVLNLKRNPAADDENSLKNEDGDKKNLTGSVCEVKSTDTKVVVNINSDVHSRTNGKVGTPASQPAEGNQVDAATKKLFSKVPPPPDTNKLMQHVLTFGAVMIYFYLCDYVKVFPMTERSYVQDTFLFLIFIFFAVGCAFTIKPTSDKILNRDQTEEWKGWMQVMFVWYHYFAAKEWYNWIRVYIAAYVWMTGFGNFSFFWVKKDFSPWRLMKMLFRLNFLVIFVCLTVKNEYMLYYICAMHTYWFLSVYVFMGVLSSWNTHRYKMLAKFAAYALFNAILFEIPGLHMTVFRPFRFIFGLVDGQHDVMHEWAFRSGLDHWVCFIGMVCAYNYPYFEALIHYLESVSIDKKEKSFKLGAKVVMGTLMACLYLGWDQFFLVKDKYPYNAIHPYTSWMPIVAYIVLRNIHPVLRTHYVSMFAWLGRITLETYLSQLHIYLQSNAKDLIGYIPGYPLLSFSLATIIYLFMSHHLFNMTTEFSAWLFPKNYKEIARKCGIVSLTFAGAGIVAYAFRSLNIA